MDPRSPFSSPTASAVSPARSMGLRGHPLGGWPLAIPCPMGPFHREHCLCPYRRGHPGGLPVSLSSVMNLRQLNLDNHEVSLVGPPLSDWLWGRQQPPLLHFFLETSVGRYHWAN